MPARSRSSLPVWSIDACTVSLLTTCLISAHLPQSTLIWDHLSHFTDSFCSSHIVRLFPKSCEDSCTGSRCQIVSDSNCVLLYTDACTVSLLTTCLISGRCSERGREGEGGRGPSPLPHWEGRWPSGRVEFSEPGVRGSIPRLGSRRSSLISIEHAELLRSTPSLVLCCVWLVTMALHVHFGLGQLSPLPTSGDDEWVAAKHCGRAKRSRISDTHRLRSSLQFRYINNQSLLFTWTVAVNPPDENQDDRSARILLCFVCCLECTPSASARPWTFAEQLQN